MSRLGILDIRRVDIQGSPETTKDDFKVYQAEIWLEDNVSYVFSFEGDFYSCKRNILFQRKC